MKFYLGSAILALALLAACSDDNSSSPAPESSSAQESSISDVASSSSEVVQESSSSESAPESSAEIESSESSADTVWNRAALTWYTSWPEPGSEECEDYNGCTWAGWFAGLEDQQTEEWVSEHNIIAIHEKDWNTYKLKAFRLRKGGYTIDAVVYDKCADSDCDGCCTQNAGELGFLIDIESYTCERLSGTKDGCDGVIEWTCLDCE